MTTMTLGARLAGETRTPEELRDAVDLFAGDVAVKQSRFWLLLVLSTVVATAGVLGDSTATVIGAMIIAPLATPIQGVAAAMANGELRSLLRSAAMVLAAALSVIALAAVLAVILPQLKPLADNSQIQGRVAPTLIDLVAATATGLAGTFALARRDIGDILPGVAISISLVPPLAVVGVTAVDGDWASALGALVLFLTNALAMIAVGAALFAWLGLARVRHGREQVRPVYAVLVVASLLVVAALSVATYRTVQLSTWRDRATRIGGAWAQSNGERLVQARFEGTTLDLLVIGKGTERDDEELTSLLRRAIPDGTPIVVDRVDGSRREVGKVGEGPSPPSR